MIGYIGWYKRSTSERRHNSVPDPSRAAAPAARPKRTASRNGISRERPRTTPASILSPAPTVLLASTGTAANRSHSCAVASNTPSAPSDSTTISLRPCSLDHFARSFLLLERGADFSPDQILQLPQARLKQ